MRYTWLTLFATETLSVPIFVELRKLNDLTAVDLRAFLRNSISSKKELSADVFDSFCESGEFCILLDGFDEVVAGKRDTLQEQILNFAADFPNCSVVLSSRYDQRFAGWSNFDVCESTPLNKNQVVDLIGRLPFDEASKNLFLKTLTQDFYNENKDFLSSPLLAIMMLMTFRKNMDIPKKMSIFYDQAFNTLYQWHDATKTYSRYKSLDIHDFQRSFSAFCLLSYHKEFLEFSRSEVINFIKMSSQVCGIKNDPQDILRDYEEAVNLIRQDGLNYVFIHRSFQEYFAAYALIRLVPEKFSECISVIEERFYDDVLKLCYELDRGKVVSAYVKPKAQELDDYGMRTRGRAKKLYYHERLGVEYTYHCFIEAHSKKANKTKIPRTMMANGFSSEIATSILGLNELFLKVKHSKKSNDFTGSSLFGSLVSGRILINIFSADEIAESIVVEDESIVSDEEKLIRITVGFGDNDFYVSLDFDDNFISVDVQRCEDIIRRAFEEKMSEFLDADKRLSSEVKELFRWSDDEIKQSIDRESSLVDILGVAME